MNRSRCDLVDWTTFLGLGISRSHFPITGVVCQPLTLDATDRKIGPLYIINAKGLAGIVPEIELGKVAI